ncbi:glycosyltransferase [Stagnimonas aquatica]|uniref:Glycosyltransferase n=1 Tax=Stagnimonas aquatica TaxID=2689987 RepID=A0A3N0V8L8_9GAMM|nr:glycosyltransferase family 2 protein [Stagnimonas aquatica]ROH89147.1 glycosyltransferase [Stagnimonas aquatica]
MVTKISIITVCYNSASTIRDTLRSVADQTHPHIEHIIVDGGSSDETVSLVQQYRRHSGPLVSEPDRGIYDAMNKGLALASGDVVGFLNSDDAYADTNVLSRVAEVFAMQTVDACYGDLVYVAANNPNRVVRYWRSRPYQPGLCSRGWMPAHPTFYVRRQAYQRYGGFDDSLRIAADFEICLRLLEVQRLRVTYLPGVLVRMRTGGVSNASLRNVVRSNREVAQALRKHGFPAGLPLILGKLASKLAQLRWSLMAPRV